MQFVLERCTVRRWRLDDAESIARHANNRKVWLAVRDLFPHPYTLQDAHEFLQRAISIGIQQQWVTGWASSSGDAAS